MTFAELLAAPQFSLPQTDKERVLGAQLRELTERHSSACADYRKIVDRIFAGGGEIEIPADVPFLPVSLFKTRALRSIPESEVFKIMHSSGTTGQVPSRIFLDRETARRQTLALSRIMTHVLGVRRLPMILVESDGIVKDRRQFNARAAGLLGMLTFGRQHFYALDDDARLNVGGLREFLERHGQEPFLIFGFTYLVWQRFFEVIAPLQIDLSNGILVHSGGWKKLVEQAVNNAEFRRRFRDATGLKKIYNFYGMVEQVGSVYLESDDGLLYAPNFADVIIRDPLTLEVLPMGEPGLIQVCSALPLSYPGHSLLTEDLGIVHHIDNPESGRLGKAFSVIGRIPRAELRGCSDVLAATVGG